MILLEAPTGAGKSTILPLHLVDEDWLMGKKIIMLEPRRLAARAVAMRMSSLLGESVGERVGYRVRFESRVGTHTRIEVVTEGILARMIQQDNALEGVGLLIFDEFHERSLQADLTLALSLQVNELLRDDLRILVMSATLDSSQLAAMLGNIPVLTSEGRQYPVNIGYLGDVNSPIPARTAHAIVRACREEQGDVLAFLPGAGEINRAKALLEEAGVDAVVHVLYGELNYQKQQEAIMPDQEGRRKIVLATSIAETSLTIEGVRIVVDSGFSRVPRFDPRSGLTRLETVRVTRDTADQRAGRAGRVGPGICYRLWSEAVHRNLLDHRLPEILEADLASLVLELSALGVRNVSELKWITAPPAGAVSQAYDLLQQLEAIDDSRKITERGRHMVRLPTHPRLAHMLMECAADESLLAMGCDVSALLEERDPLQREGGADLSLRISLLRRWRSGERVAGDTRALERIERLAASWRKLFRIKVHNNDADMYAIGRLLVLAYPERIARQGSKNSERYKLANGRAVKLPDHDPLMREPWLAIASVDSGVQEGRIFLAAPLDERDLNGLCHKHDVVRWNRERNRIESLIEKRIGTLVLVSHQSSTVNPERKAQVLCRTIRENGLKFVGWSEVHSQWQARVMSLRMWRPLDLWPDVSDHNLIETIEEWLGPHLTDVYTHADILNLDLQSILDGLLGWERCHSLDRLAPTRLEVPSGSKISIRYAQDGSDPVMEVRLQEVFGLLETPTINDGRTRLVLHLLSPGFKPVQVTQDLRSFWSRTYAEVRKELQRRYPKHSWPEDPFTAKAIRGAVKRRA